ncbi:MAG: efflux RND transporter periplasmic adaptor subunit [Pseudomonadota bacterium]
MRSVGIRRYLLLIAVGGLAACGGDDTFPQQSASALLVNAFEVEAADQYDALQRFSGQVMAARQSSLGFELGGELAAVAVDDGDQVSAGAELARLDTRRLAARRAEAAAALAQATSRADLARSTFERVERALAFEGVSTQEVDVARDNLTASETAQTAARSALQRVDIDLAKSVITAPYDGAVLVRLVDEGQIVAAGQPVFEFQESAALEVRLSVSGDALDTLATGAQVTLAINDQPVSATVTAIIARRDMRTRAVDVILAIDAGAPARVGDIAELRYARTVLEAGYWVPLDALTEGARGVWNVLAIMPAEDRLDAAEQRATGATHALQNRPVELLHHEDQRVFVRGGIAAGDVIVANGLQRVVPGQGVRVAQPDTLAEIQ